MSKTVTYRCPTCKRTTKQMEGVTVWCKVDSHTRRMEEKK